MSLKYIKLKIKILINFINLLLVLIILKNIIFERKNFLFIYLIKKY